MNRYLKLAISIVATAIYLATLRYFLPGNEPYFLFSIAVTSLVAWFHGAVPALITIWALIPPTKYIYELMAQDNIIVTYAPYAPAYLAIQILMVIALGHLRRERIVLLRKDQDLEETKNTLQDVLSHVHEMGGIHSICSQCKKIQDDKGMWKPIETFLKKETKMEFSHGICPDCAEKYIGQP